MNTIKITKKNDILERPSILHAHQPRLVKKEWGREVWIYNGIKYCGKVLQFNPSARFSLHYHVQKEETWYISKGNFTLISINPKTANEEFNELIEGDIVHIFPGLSHQLIAGKDGGEIFEASTTHYDTDSYRIRR